MLRKSAASMQLSRLSTAASELSSSASSFRGDLPLCVEVNEDSMTSDSNWGWFVTFDEDDDGEYWAYMDD